MATPYKWENGAQSSVGIITEWKGAWATSTAYNLGEGVSNDGSSYICKLAHTSGAASEPGTGASWATYWDLVVQKGEKGDTGSTGATGATGATGPQGATGATGAKGDKGDTGASIVSAAFNGDDILFTKDDANTIVLDDAKIDLKGDKGDKGDTGNTGPQGAQGPQGPQGPQGEPGTGSGDVAGPASAVDGNFASFDGSGGKTIKDSGSKASDFAPAAHAHSSITADDDGLRVKDAFGVNALSILAGGVLGALRRLSILVNGADRQIDLSGNLTVSSAATVSGTNTGDQTLPVKATGAEIDTGTDDAKFATAKALKDSGYLSGMDDVTTASDSVAGKVELATAAETTAGADTGRAVTPDGLAGSSIFGIKTVEIMVFDAGTDCATGDGKAYFVVRQSLNGMNLVAVHARAITAGTTGTMDIQIRNVTDSVDMLSTKLTIDSTETGSETAATAAVIDNTKDDVATNDLLAIDVDAVQTTKAKGLIISLDFQLP